MSKNNEILALLSTISHQRQTPNGIRYQGIRMPREFFPSILTENFLHLTDCGEDGCEVFVNVESRVIMDYYPENGAMYFYHAFTLEHFKNEIEKLKPFIKIAQ